MATPRKVIPAQEYHSRPRSGRFRALAIGNFIGELKRRRVFRTVVGYGVVAFGLLQVIEPVMHGLHWPDEVLTWVVVALAAGFPITVGLAWIFDVNAGHIERTKATEGLGRTRLIAGLAALSLMAAAPGVAWYFWLRPAARAPKPDASIPSIAVLPLLNLSSDKEQEYFSDGLTEELLNLLAKVPGLNVAARTSAFAFKGKNASMIEIGRALGVTTVLEGSVRKSGDRVRITTQLIKVSDGYHLWSETYDRELTDIFAVQDEIANAVVTALKLQLLPAQKTASQRTANTEAYLKYLEGRKLLADFNLTAFDQARSSFQRAVELDPRFAPAWCGLGFARAYLGLFYKGRAEGLDDVEKSIALAPDLAEAYVARAFIRIQSHYDWEGARADFDRALALNPGEPNALLFQSFFLHAYRGQFGEAETTLQAALQRDPLNATLVHTLGCIYLFAGDLQRARQTFDQELTLRPRMSSQDIWPLYLLQLEGKSQAALDASTRTGDAQLDEGWRLVGTAIFAHAIGREKESLAALAQLKGPRFAGFAVQVAQVLAFRGEKDEAFAWLDKAYGMHDPGLMRLKVDPLLHLLSGDARYTALLKKMNLPLN